MSAARALEFSSPTSRDLLADLRAVTPGPLQYLLTDLFETITRWDVEARNAVVERTNGGQYQVTLDVAARKMRDDSVGRETETPMNDFVEIGVFAPGNSEGPRHDALRRPLLRRGRLWCSVAPVYNTTTRSPCW